jgi:hypothetical protein
VLCWEDIPQTVRDGICRRTAMLMGLKYQTRASASRAISMTPWTARELDHVAVRSLDDHSSQLHDVEALVGQHLGHTLPFKLVDGSLANFHQASSLGGLVSYDRLPSIAASAPRYQKIALAP